MFICLAEAPEWGRLIQCKKRNYICVTAACYVIMSFWMLNILWMKNSSRKCNKQKGECAREKERMSSSRKKQPSLDKANIERNNNTRKKNESTAYKHTHTHSYKTAKRICVKISDILCTERNHFVSIRLRRCWCFFSSSLFYLFVWNCAILLLLYRFGRLPTSILHSLRFMHADLFLFFCRHRSFALTLPKF